MSTGNVVAGVDDLDWDDSSDEFFLPLGGATTDENDRPPFSKFPRGDYRGVGLGPAATSS